MITEAQIRKAAKGRVDPANLNSVLVALRDHGADFGLDLPHRQAHYLAQLMHESGDFRFDKEIWGPTPAQVRYDTRTDLGNTPAVDGDGFKYRGRAGIQITGKANYETFTKWCRKSFGSSPDFVANPDAVNTDPWEGLVPIWYWSTRNLNEWADQNDIETITKKINGGKNGLGDRIDRYGRLAIVTCGYEPTDAGIRQFQRDNGVDVDGDIGPKTRAELHKRLMFSQPHVGLLAPMARAAPVVEETVVEKPIVPVAVEQEVKQKSNWLSSLFGGGFSIAGIGTWLTGGIDRETLLIVLGAAAFGGLVFLIGGRWIVQRVKTIRNEIES
jgi:putative chitinase